MIIIITTGSVILLARCTLCCNCNYDIIIPVYIWMVKSIHHYATLFTLSGILVSLLLSAGLPYKAIIRYH